MRRIHLFRAGRHRPMAGEPIEFSAAVLAEIAAGYDAARYEAPIVVGHPPMDAPAYGWVESVSAEGDDLFVAPRQVEPQFAQLVKDGRFKKVSASFFGPAHPRNPTPGKWHLKHVGFLGATPPAVQGLKPVQFGADADAVTIEFAAEAAHVVAVEFAADPTQQRSTKVTEQHAGPTPEALAARERALAEREAAFAARETEMRRAADRQVVDGLVAEARLPQGVVPRVLAFMAGLDAADEVSFAAADGKPVKEPARDAFVAILQALPKAVEFAERGAGAGPEAGGAPASAEFAGHRVDPDRLALHRRALAYQRQHPDTDYATAALAVESAG